MPCHLNLLFIYALVLTYPTKQTLDSLSITHSHCLTPLFSCNISPTKKKVKQATLIFSFAFLLSFFFVKFNDISSIGNNFILSSLLSSFYFPVLTQKKKNIYEGPSQITAWHTMEFVTFNADTTTLCC